MFKTAIIALNEVACGCDCLKLAVVRSGALDHLVRAAASDEYWVVQASLVCISTVSSGCTDSRRAVAQAQTVTVLVRRLASPREALVFYALDALHKLIDGGVCAEIGVLGTDVLHRI